MANRYDYCPPAYRNECRQSAYCFMHVTGEVNMSLASQGTIPSDRGKSMPVENLYAIWKEKPPFERRSQQ
jgi:hypothetical protein